MAKEQAKGPVRQHYALATGEKVNVPSKAAKPPKK